jgi:hypothetical protein
MTSRPDEARASPEGSGTAVALNWKFQSALPVSIEGPMRTSPSETVEPMENQ